MSGRVACVVPGCRRTQAAERMADPRHTQYLCQKHFALVDLRLKRLRGRLLRRHGGCRNYGWRVDCWIWKRMVRQAIERAAGL